MLFIVTRCLLNTVENITIHSKVKLIHYEDRPDFDQVSKDILTQVRARCI